jgi:hypothetical protein
VADAGCTGLLICLRCCSGDAECGACWDATSDAMAGLGYAMLYGCPGQHCGQECGFNPSYPCGIFAPGGTACHSCMDASCCTEGAAASDSSGAMGLDVCRNRRAGDTVCIDACNRAYRQADNATLDAFWTCMDTGCAAECPGGAGGSGGSGG